MTHETTCMSMKTAKTKFPTDNVSPKRVGIPPLSFLYIGDSCLYMYIKGQWTLSAPF